MTPSGRYLRRQHASGQTSWLGPSRPTARRLDAGTIPIRSAINSRSMLTNRGWVPTVLARTIVQTEFVAQRPGLVVQVVEHLHVIRQEPDRVNHDASIPRSP